MTRRLSPALSLRHQLQIVAIPLVLMSLLEIFNLFSGYRLNQFGIIPRYLPALPNIFFSPFLHGSLSHFISNILPMGILSFLVLQHGLKRYLLVSFIGIFLTGLLVWLFARPAMHIGASGLIYCYLGYLVLAGFLSRQLKLILIAIGVALFYGGLIWGVLPTRSYVSWESHLFGLIAGLVTAWLFTRIEKS